MDCSKWAAPRGMRWQAAPCGARLVDGGNARALIIPAEPRAWNGRARWQVDAIGLRRAQYVRTLADARALAHAHA